MPFPVIHDTSVEYDMEQVYSWIEKASNGLQYLHEEGVLHRDINPKNILLGKSLDDLKISDFGLAKAVELQITASHTYGIGTLAYMAPELHDGIKYGKSADIYALTITFWEIIHRERPYGYLGEITPFKKINRILNGARPNIQEELEISALLIRGWDNNPKSRPKISEFIEFSRKKRPAQENFRKVEKWSERQKNTSFFDCNFPQIEQSSVNIGDQISFTNLSIVHHAKSSDYGDVVFKIFVSSSGHQEYNQRELKYAVLRHPNIVQSLAVVLNEDNMPNGFLMEFMPYSLADVIIKPEFQYSISQVLDWMLKVCAALLFLHNLNIMHRDVKPANIMVEVDKSGFISKVKLTDFGIAGSIYQNPDITHTCAIGTTLYQAQEINDGHYDEKVDVYSTGVTLWQLIHRKVNETQFSKGSESNPYFAEDCSVEIKDLINECCCAKEDRLSIEQLIDRLKTLIDEYKKETRRD